MPHPYVKRRSYMCVVEPRFTDGWGMSHIWMSHVDEACHTYERVMWTKHVTHMNEPHDMLHLYVKRGSNMCVTWFIYLCDMAHPHVKHGSYTRVTWLTHLCGMPCPRVKYDSLCVTWLIVRDMTHSYVWQDSFVFVTGLIHMCNMTHSYGWHDSFICVTWLIHMCDRTHPHSHTGWQKDKECLKLKISLRKKATTYRHLFQRMTCKNKASHAFSPFCIQMSKPEHDATNFDRTHDIPLAWRIHM